MIYKNAQLMLLDASVKELQSYVQGDYIYVPVEYQSGISINCLAEKYCLSLYAVRKIIYQK